MLRDFTCTEKYKEAMSDEHPLNESLYIQLPDYIRLMWTQICGIGIVNKKWKKKKIYKLGKVNERIPVLQLIRSRN